jgi:ATP-dependent RNA helicase DeaD
MPGRPIRPGPGPRPGAAAGQRPFQGGPGGPPRGGDRPGSSGPWVRLFVGGGRRAGLRPGDLVGAITNEAHVPGGVVGAIQINEGFSLVDVQEGVADAVIAALREATIRGKRLQVRRDD